MAFRVSLNAFSSAPVPGLRFEESSLIRRITEVVSTIFCNMWRTLSSKWGEVAQKPVETTPEIEQLRHTRQLGPGAIRDVCVKLTESHKNFEFVESFMFGQVSHKLPDFDGKKDFIMIPVVLEGLIEDHIVLVAYDRKMNQIEFYDPKGLTCSDYSNKVRGTQYTITEVVREVAAKYGDDKATLWENTQKDQKDSHNCGVYVLHYIEQRTGGKSVQEIAQQPLAYEDANGAKRRDFMALLTEQVAQPTQSQIIEISPEDLY